MNYKEMMLLSDEQLVELARSGETDAEEILLTRYKDVVLSKTNIYYIVGGDRDDIVQEGMIGLVKAVRGFDPDAGASFATFARLCVARQIITAMRAASREKHAPLNDAISLDVPLDGNNENTLADTIAAGPENDPVEISIKTELLNMVLNPKKGSFSKLEHATIKYLTQGKNYREIADLLGKSPKQIDNTIQRIRTKIKDMNE